MACDAGWSDLVLHVLSSTVQESCTLLAIVVQWFGALKLLVEPGKALLEPSNRVSSWLS